MRSHGQLGVDFQSAQASDHQSAETLLFDFDNSTPSGLPPTSNSPGPGRRSSTPHVQPQVTATEFRIPPRMNITSPFNSILTMPIPGTKLAPEKFRGDFHKVKEFIQHYERLCAQNNVTSDAEKCETVLRYCSKREKQTIKNIPSFTAKSWGRLREDILRLYDADLDTRRYRVKDVRNFSKKQKGKRIRDLAGWKKYCRAFLRIAGSLLVEKKISEGEYATYFWQGIPKVLRARLENRILAKDPVRDLSEPFGVGEIDTAASAILQRDRFDRALDDSESDEADSSEEESSSESEDDETSESESEDEKEKRRRRKKKISRRGSSRESKRHSSSRDESVKEATGKRSVSAPQRDVESLIKQMNLLTQDDPEYGIAYYRALKLDPDVARIVSEPALKRMSGPVYRPQRAVTYQQTMAPVPDGSPGSIPYAPRTVRTSQPPARGGDMICYGCGEKGHGMHSCPTINKLVERDVLIWDIAGKLVYKDGSPIRRMYDETYIRAVERAQAPQSNFVTIEGETDGEFGYMESESDDESDGENYGNEDEGYDRWEDAREDVFAIQEAGWRSWFADRPEKKIAAKKRMVIEGVYPPRLKELVGGKENRPADPQTGRPVRTGKAQQSGRVTKPVEHVETPRKVQEPTPIDVDEPRYDASKDSGVVEDQSGKIKTFQKERNEEVPDKARASADKRLPRRSAVSAQVNPLAVLDQVLNAKVELAVGELIGVSRELSSQLANVIKPKTAKASDSVGLTTIGNTFRTKTRGLLIKVTMECDGNSIQGIIDTGSQLNIVNEKICKSRIKRPIDYSATVSMNDANGGEGKLGGIVENVPLDYGSVRTRANLFVGAHVPFDLLLGRPWQRGNFVSIDEQEDGTYLVFKDPNTMEPRHKVLVTPDSIVPNDWDFDPSTWHVGGGSKSFYMRENGGISDKEESEDEDDVSKALMADYPHLNEWEFPSLYMGKKRNMSAIARELLRPWLQRILLRKLLKGPITVEEWSHEHQQWVIKEIQRRPVKNPPVYSSSSASSSCLPDMEIKVGPAAVKHEADLPALFSSTTTARSEAETLLSGIGDIPHFTRNQHTRDLVLSSHDGVVVGHCIDEQGYRRTDLMLLNMGLVTPKSPEDGTPSSELDVQYGTALVHFYPNLGGEAPPNWEIPYLFPPPLRAVVSGTMQFGAELDAEKLSKVGPGDDLRPRSLPPPPQTLSITRDDDDESIDTSDPESSDDEVGLLCASCLAAHHGTCSAVTPISLAHANLVINCGIERSNPRATAYSGSLPSLVSVSDSSNDSEEGSEDEDFNSEKWKTRWERMRESLLEELEEEKNENIAEWEAYQQTMREERDREREEETARCLEDERSHRESSIASTRYTTPISDDSSAMGSSLLLAPPSRMSIPPIATIEEELRVERERASRDPDRILDTSLERLLSPEFEISRVRDDPLHFASRNASDGKGFYAGSHGIDPKLLMADPVQVYTVQIPMGPPPPFLNGFLRPPTPFPRQGNPFFDNNVPLPDEFALRMPVKQEERTERSPPAYGASLVIAEVKVPVDEDHSFHPAEDGEITEEGMMSRPPSPTDTEPIGDIESLMLPPKKRQLPRPPVVLRPSRYTDIRANVLDAGRGGKPPVCFKPHILALDRDRPLYPFIETIRPGPLTDRTLPIWDRPYYPYADLDVHYNIPRIRKLILVNTRTLTPVRDNEEIPAGQTSVFTRLAPRNAPAGLIFPGMLWPSSFGPLDFPQVSARTIGERLAGLRRTRQSLVAFVDRVRSSLTPWQLKEAHSKTITLFTEEGNRLVEKEVSRYLFFRIIHPTFNPLITRREARFLRSACYAMHSFQHDVVATGIDNALRTPQLDMHLCERLLEKGCLEEDGDDAEAFRILEEYEGNAQGLEDEAYAGAN